MSQNVGKIQESDCFTVIVLLRFEGLHPHQVKPRTIQLVFAASMLSPQH
jgi:hypothetical protein